MNRAPKDFGDAVVDAINPPAIQQVDDGGIPVENAQPPIAQPVSRAVKASFPATAASASPGIAPSPDAQVDQSIERGREQAEMVQGWVSDVLATWRTQLRVMVHGSLDAIPDADLRARVQAEDGAVEGMFNGADGVIQGVDAPTARDYAAGLELLPRLQAAGRLEDAAALIEVMAERATGQGQAIQALSLGGTMKPCSMGGVRGPERGNFWPPILGHFSLGSPRSLLFRRRRRQIRSF